MHLYFRRFFAHFGVRMTRRFSRFLVGALTGWLAAQLPPRAGAADAALTKSTVFEGNVAYLQVGQVGKNLAGEIRAAQSALAVSNKIAGTVMDLRFAGGDNLDSARATADLFASKRLPLAILVNAQTHGAAEKLASQLREERAGLVFQSIAGQAKTNNEMIGPGELDIMVAASPAQERAFMKNPYAAPPPTNADAQADTNSLLPLVDHTTEADLVRAKIKDGAEFEAAPATRAAKPPHRVIRDPVLARAVDLIKGLAVVRESHS